MSDGIIDLTQYLQREDDDDPDAGSTFALWGADGERSRFALPLWRSIYLAGGDRGGIVWLDPVDPDSLRPFVVLDLAQDPPRTVFTTAILGARSHEEPPALRDEGAAGLSVLLGRREGRQWFMVVEGGEDRESPVRGRDREDILFLSGECAGLLFLRDFADEA
jgi:hypothetical protein